ncbi:hypothetical protein NT6N_30830 [Oceaniferula spumae]|uniref:Zinc ribbon domain-containing protein n=1 Tax=Oceaniferula spumae TaxID=2979115 RepID=A0AAT9FPZ2_9BACT
MTEGSKPSQASFPCQHCRKVIYIPVGLPPTVAPCPHCGEAVKSPEQKVKPMPGPETKKLAAAVAELSLPPAPSEEKPIRLSASEAAESAASTKKAPAVKMEPLGGTSDVSSATDPKATKSGKKSSIAAVIAAVAILLVAGMATIWLAGKWKKDQAGNAVAGGNDTPVKEMSEADWLERGWQAEAAKVLEGYLTAEGPLEQMQYVIPNEGVLEELQANFANSKATAETPLSAFSYGDNNLKDRQRGIFLMQYRRPAQIDMREYFAPIGNIETVMGQTPPSLIEMAHRIDEDSLVQPMSINAFFKKTKDGLKLDSSVFIQGKFRTFHTFTEFPQPGHSQIFRVVINEVLSHKLRDDPSKRAYKLADYAYPQDFVNLPVDVDSEVGKILSVLNWRGMDRDAFPRTATVELAWSETSPSVLELKRVLCWEFLGVGGEIGNTDVPEEPESKTAVAEPSPEAQ